MGQRRSCRLIRFRRSSCLYESCDKNVRALVARMKELAASRPRYGYRRLHIFLQRKGRRINHKRVHRLYKMHGLQLRVKHRKKRAAAIRMPLAPAVRVNQRWSMDFIHDALEDGRRFQILTVVDNYSRECPLLKADLSLNAAKGIECLEQLKLCRGLPETITVDNGTEFFSRAMMPGHTGTRSGWIFFGRESRSRTPASKVSTAG